MGSQRILHAACHGGQRRQMENPGTILDRRCHCNRVGNAAETNVDALLDRVQFVAPPRSQIAQHPKRVPCGEQMFHEVRTDETGLAGEQADCHGCLRPEGCVILSCGIVSSSCHTKG
jgi:hypothetical protein